MSCPGVQGGAGGEAVSFGFGCASEDTTEVMTMFSDVITSPALLQQRVDRIKAQVPTHPGVLIHPGFLLSAALLKPDRLQVAPHSCRDPTQPGPP